MIQFRPDMVEVFECVPVDQKSEQFALNLEL